jgi:hypothetical protein
MFLCDTCHLAANCLNADFDAMWAPRSRGQCESCGKSSSCIDCHSYGKAKPAEPAKPKMPYATAGVISKMEPARGPYQEGEIGWILGDDGRSYQFSGFGAETGPNYQQTIFRVGERVSFKVLHIGGEGFTKYPSATNLKRAPKA